MNDIQQLFHMVNDIVCSSLLQFFPSPVAPCNTTGFCAGIGSHENIYCHVPDNKCLASRKAHGDKGFQDRFWHRLRLFHIVSPDQVRDTVCYAHVMRKLYKGNV